MWGTTAAPMPSMWEPQVRALAPRGAVRDSRPTPPSRKPAATPRPSPTPGAADKRNAASCTNMAGVLLEFDTLSSVKTLPPEFAKRVGFASAQYKVAPGAYDKFLRGLKAGHAENAIKFEFNHREASATASTSDGTLKIFADRRALYFTVDGSTRDGAKTVKLAQTHGWRQMSVGHHIYEFTAVPGKNGESNIVYVTLAELVEVSLVPTGSFPRTCASFL